MHISDDLLSKILSNDNPSKVQILHWYITNDIIPIGNNHCTVLSRLTVEYQKKAKILNKSFILKIPSAHPIYNVGNQYKIYEREFLVYTEILEQMYHLDGEHVGPRLYHADTKNSLMLKDLTQSGYKMVDRTKQLDFDQCSLVFKALAKFHGLSIKLHHLSKIPSQLYQSTWLRQKSDTQDFLQQLMNNAFHQVLKHLENTPLKNKLLQIINDDVRTKASEEIVCDKFTFMALNHGDCWNGNLMFKFDKYGCVKKVKLIDFQNCLWTSPMLDLLTFAITSMQFDVFESYFDLLVDQYVTILNKTLNFLHCQPYECINMKNDFKYVRHFIIVILLVILPETISSHENPIDYKKAIKNDEINLEELNKIYGGELYLKILHKWLHYFDEQGIFE